MEASQGFTLHCCTRPHARPFQCARSFTVDGKDVPDLLLDDPQSHFYSVGVGHGVHLVGVQAVEVKDLDGRR